MAGHTASGAVRAGRALVGTAALTLTVFTSLTAAPAGSGTGGAPADSGSLRGSEWALTALKAEQAWKTSKGRGVTVAVIGTGVDASHPDLKGRVLKGADVGDGSTVDGRRDQGAAQVQGTHQAGIIAGTGRNYRGDGLHGLAPQAHILPFRVFRNDKALTAATARAIMNAARQGAQVIDVTVSSPQPSDDLRTAVEYAAQQGALVVAGAGDTGRTGNEASYPAAFPQVLSVAATDKKGSVWPGSHHGKDVDLAAPGVDILTTARNDGYWTGSGTGYAAGWVAASAALLRAEHPKWTVSQVTRELTRTATHHKSAAWDPRYGFGIVASAAALADHRSPPAASGKPANQAVAASDRTAYHSSDTGPTMVVAAVMGALIVLAVPAWFLIRRSVTPSDDD
ncbi:S8 family serine peptidase [Streptomyces sp. NPDC050287]|uniref:S8 family serine peptidase n=1 Tax=Streptomyces sp. NPDC050287 TaxID=3365608 RepID=UPI003787AB86